MAMGQDSPRWGVSLCTPQWRNSVTSTQSCQTGRPVSVMTTTMLDAFVVGGLTVDLRVGPRDDGAVAGRLLALLHDEVDKVRVQRVGTECHHGADALAQIEALGDPLVPHVALVLRERDERLGHLQDGQTRAARVGERQVLPDRARAAFERHALHRLGLLIADGPDQPDAALAGLAFPAHLVPSSRVDAAPEDVAPDSHARPRSGHAVGNAGATSSGAA